jgi:hypothetical protein
MTLKGSGFTARVAILAAVLAILGVTFGALAATGVFEAGGSAGSGRTVCEGVCLRLPAGWTAGTLVGGTSGELSAAPFKLPSWVREGVQREGVVEIPKGQFVIMITTSARRYDYGWDRAKRIAVSPGALRQDEQALGRRSLAVRNVTFRGRSVSVGVQFADSRPTNDQFSTVNRILATAYLDPPPPFTH